MKNFAPMIIPDAELAEYLKDKLLIKPDYDASVGPTTIESDYASVKRRMDEMRKDNNDKTKRSYGLKGKK
jgi:hypothetical protein